MQKLTHKSVYCEHACSLEHWAIWPGLDKKEYVCRYIEP